MKHRRDSLDFGWFFLQKQPKDLKLVSGPVGMTAYLAPRVSAPSINTFWLHAVQILSDFLKWKEHRWAGRI